MPGWQGFLQERWAQVDLAWAWNPRGTALPCVTASSEHSWPAGYGTSAFGRIGRAVCIRCLGLCSLLFVLDPHPPADPTGQRLTMAALSEKALGGLGSGSNWKRSSGPTLPSLPLLFLPHPSSTAFPKRIAHRPSGAHPCLPSNSAPLRLLPPSPLPATTSCLLPPPGLVCGQGPSARGLHACPRSTTGALDPGHMGGVTASAWSGFRHSPPASAAPRWCVFSHQVLFSSFLPVFALNAMNLIW